MRTDLFWIDGPWTGRLAIMPRPRGGDWLEDEMQAWRRAGVDVVLSLLMADEVADLGLGDEERWCQAVEIEFRTFPLTDRSVPSSVSAVAELAAAGKNVAVHCRQGIGRAALVAICLLVVGGVDAKTADERVGKARGCSVPETAEQQQWVVDFERAHRTK